MTQGHATVTDDDMREQGYLLISEAARKVGVAVQTIYRWIDNEDNPCEGVRDGFRRYVLWSSVLEHLGDGATLRGFTQKDVWVETAPDED